MKILKKVTGTKARGSLPTIPKGESEQNLFTIMLISFSVEKVLQLFDRIRNQRPILRFFQPVLIFCEKTFLKEHITDIRAFFKLFC